MRRHILLTAVIAGATAAGGYFVGAHDSQLKFKQGLVAGLWTASTLCDHTGAFDFNKRAYVCTRKDEETWQSPQAQPHTGGA